MNEWWERLVLNVVYPSYHSEKDARKILALIGPPFPPQKTIGDSWHTLFYMLDVFSCRITQTTVIKTASTSDRALITITIIRPDSPTSGTWHYLEFLKRATHFWWNSNVQFTHIIKITHTGCIWNVLQWQMLFHANYQCFCTTYSVFSINFSNKIYCYFLRACSFYQGILLS